MRFARASSSCRAVFALLAVLVAVCAGSAARAEPLVIATSKTGWLIWIADQRGLFAENGVDVRVEQASSGVAASKGLIEGKFDLATMSEFAFASRSFDHADLRIVGTVAAIDNVRLVARSDKGISTAVDLQGKRIGVLRKAIGEFCLGKLLDINGIDATEITAVSLRPAKLPEALASGSIDAVVSWEPYASQAGIKVGDKRVDMAVQGGQPYYFVLAAKEKLVRSAAPRIQRVIRALYEAAQWASAHQSAAQDLLSTHLKLDLAAIQKFWPDHIMDVALPHDMLFLMEEEAAWRVSNGLSKGLVPDFLSRIDQPFLMEVDPAQVTIIR